MPRDMHLAGVSGAAAAAAEAALALSHPNLSPPITEDLRTAARVAAATANNILTSPPATRAPARRIGGARRKRTAMRLEVRLQIVAWRDEGKSWVWILCPLNGQYSESAVNKTCKRKDEFVARAAAGVRDDSMSAKTGAFPELDAQLLAWFPRCARAAAREYLCLSLSCAPRPCRLLFRSACPTFRLPMATS